MELLGRKFESIRVLDGPEIVWNRTPHGVIPKIKNILSIEDVGGGSWTYDPIVPVIDVSTGHAFVNQASLWVGAETGIEIPESFIGPNPGWGYLVLSIDSTAMPTSTYSVKSETGITDVADHEAMAIIAAVHVLQPVGETGRVELVQWQYGQLRINTFTECEE
jgi:hypothetical protein